MNYNGCTITINPCQAHGWRGWFDYEATNGRQSVTGRSRGTKREVVSYLKWKIDHKEMFPIESNITQRAADATPQQPPRGEVWATDETLSTGV